MSHLDAVINAARNAFEKRRLEQLYAKPAPYVGRFEIPTYRLIDIEGREEGCEGRVSYRKRMQPCTLRGHAKTAFDENRSYEQTVAGVVFSPDRFLNEPEYLLKSRDEGSVNAARYKKRDSDFIERMERELAFLKIEAYYVQHSGSYQHKGVALYTQKLLFVPSAHIEYLDDDRKLPVETNCGNQLELFLAYLLVKGLLDPDKPENLERIRETFLVYDPTSDGMQKLCADVTKKLDHSGHNFNPHSVPKYDPTIKYG